MPIVAYLHVFGMRVIANWYYLYMSFGCIFGYHLIFLTKLDRNHLIRNCLSKQLSQRIVRIILLESSFNAGSKVKIRCRAVQAVLICDDIFGVSTLKLIGWSFCHVYYKV